MARPFEPKLTAAQWREVQEHYETGSASIASIARNYGVTTAAVTIRAKKEKWRRSAAREIAACVVKRVTGADQVENIYDERRRVATIKKVAEDIAVVLLNHRTEWAEIDQIKAKAITALFDPEFVPENDDEPERWKSERVRVAYAAELFKVYKTAAEAVSTKQEGQRRSYGLDFRQQSEDKPKDAGLEARRQELLESLRKIGQRAASDGAKVIEGHVE